MKKRETILKRAHRLRLKWRESGGAQVVTLRRRRPSSAPEDALISDAEVAERLRSGELRPWPSNGSPVEDALLFKLVSDFSPIQGVVSVRGARPLKGRA